jgi:hypothetical protein
MQMRVEARDKNPHSIGTSATCRNFACAKPPPKILSIRDLPNRFPLLRCGGGARHLHTKLSGVTVIFFLL